MKKTITLDTPIRFYAQISRVDPTERIVEGYCYVNPTVRGDKWDLTRAAMEEAGAEYEKAPAIRAMHQPIAAGVGLGLIWDDKGCLIRAHITDDNEWHKVETGTYRGFSIGGKPRIVRGNTVTKFDWIETSLVDRPCDPDALFTMARADSVEGEYQVEVEDGDALQVGEAESPNIDEPATQTESEEGADAEATEVDSTETERVAKVDLSGTATVPTFSDMVGSIKDRAAYSTIQAACYALSDVLSMAPDNAVRKQNISEFSKFLNKYLDEADAETARAESSDLKTRLEAPLPDAAELARIQAVVDEHESLVHRAEAAESELTVARADLESARGELSTAKEEVDRLRKIEVNRKPPVEFPNAVGISRTFQANDETTERRTELNRERDDILARSKDLTLTDADRNRMAARLASIDIEMGRLR